MPHIRAIFPEGESEVVRILTNHGLQIREALSAQFPKYPVEQIAIIPEPISERVMKLASNLLPLEFAIDVGKQQWESLDDGDSDALRDRLIEMCPGLGAINFGIWLREMTSNGYSEHKP